MKSLVVKRSVVIAGHKTSVSLEDAFFRQLKDIAGQRNQTISALIGEIDSRRTSGSLSSALRLFVLAALQDALFILEHFGETSDEKRGVA